MSVKIGYGCRWEGALERAIENLGGGKLILRVEYESDYQGYLDIDILLNDGRVFSYQYSYGSCSGCDQWEDSEYDEGYDSGYPKLAELMQREATIFDNEEEYKKWREEVNKEGEI